VKEKKTENKGLVDVKKPFLFLRRGKYQSVAGAGHLDSHAEAPGTCSNHQEFRQQLVNIQKQKPKALEL